MEIPVKPGFLIFFVIVSDYYQILGVRAGASMPEIRRAYRVLVQRLHPDINPDPAAHELIKAVNEAYDVLSDPVKKQEYDLRIANAYTTPSQPVHRDPAYRRKAYSYKPERKETQNEMMVRYMPVIHKIFAASLAVAVFLFVDLLLPHKQIPDSVARFSSNRSARYGANYLHTAAGERIKISVNDAYNLGLGEPVEIVKSRILSILIEVRVPNEERVIDNLSTIYANFKFVLWVLLIFSTVGMSGKGWVEFKFNLGIMTFFVLIFTMFLLIK